MKNLRDHIRAFGYSRLNCLYYRRHGETLENDLVLFTYENKMIKLKSDAKKNKNMIDVYL